MCKRVYITDSKVGGSIVTGICHKLVDRRIHKGSKKQTGEDQWLSINYLEKGPRLSYANEGVESTTCVLPLVFQSIKMLLQMIRCVKMNNSKIWEENKRQCEMERKHGERDGSIMTITLFKSRKTLRSDGWKALPSALADWQKFRNLPISCRCCG